MLSLLDLHEYSTSNDEWSMQEFECERGTKDRAVDSFHSTTSWIVQIARRYELVRDPMANVKMLVDELRSEEFLDKEVCDQIIALSTEHDEIAVSNTVDHDRIRLFEKRLRSLERAITSVVIVDDEEDSEYRY